MDNCKHNIIVLTLHLIILGSYSLATRLATLQLAGGDFTNGGSMTSCGWESICTSGGGGTLNASGKFCRGGDMNTPGWFLPAIGGRMFTGGGRLTPAGGEDENARKGAGWSLPAIGGRVFTGGGRLTPAGGEDENARNGAGGSSGNTGGMMVVPGGGGDATSGEKDGFVSPYGVKEGVVNAGGGEGTTTDGGIGWRRKVLGIKWLPEVTGENGHWSLHTPKNGTQFVVRPRRVRAVGSRPPVTVPEEASSKNGSNVIRVCNFTIVDCECVVKK